LPALPVDHDNLPGPGSPDVDALYPISITNGAAGASDTITVRYSNPPGTTIPLPTSIVAPVSATQLQVSSNYGCTLGDIAVVVRNNGSCSSSRVTSTAAQLNANSTELRLASVNAAQMPNGARLTCIGSVYSVVGFTVAGNELTRNGTAILSEIVNLQAQYGITGSTSAAIKGNQITQWVDAGALANPNRIRAIRVAVVARNNQLEKTNVTAAAPISWTGGPAINLNANADWQRYRYRVYEAIIPIRNLAFSGALL
jgi:type IV pilus assembly protein PilW